MTCQESSGFVRRAVIACLGLLLVGLSPAHADIINVPGDYPTIQEAIDAANDGDEVVIAQGEYFENISLRGKAITVRSTDPTDANTIVSTIINGGRAGSVVLCIDWEGPDTILNGLVITNGDGENGGGMWIYGSPTIMNCTFSRNNAQRGGGLYHMGEAIITNCTFINNTAETGGGIANSGWDLTMTGCLFIGNVAAGQTWSTGGAMLSYEGSLTLQDCKITANSAEGDGTGGMHVYTPHNGRTWLRNCHIIDNSSVGLHAEGVPPMLWHSIVCGNMESQIHGQYGDAGNNIIGPHPPPLQPSCPADIDGDGDVDTADLLALLGSWGMCP